MKIRSAKFLVSAVSPDQYPPVDLPEVAFVGRSNVGKSSLINRLVNRKNLVRTSKTPGCTQMLNFFEINHRWRFVDLPGYGYARVPVAVRKQWRPMVETYLLGRDNLRGIVFILDARRLPSPDDLTLWYWLQSRALPVILVVTKVDKLSRNKRAKQASRIAGALGCTREDLIAFSATTGEGCSELWKAVEMVIGTWIGE